MMKLGRVFAVMALAAVSKAQDLATTIKDVQASWAAVQGVGNCDGVAVMDIFYNNLLESAEMKTIFNATSASSTTLTVQKERLWAMLNAAVSGLDDVNALVPTLRALGARHKNYGVNESHFGAVGASLIYTLGQGLGDAFNDTLKNEWLTIYGVVKTEMVKGLNDPDNTTVVADKQAAYGLTPLAAGLPQCVAAAEPATPDLATTIKDVQASWTAVQGVGNCDGVAVMDIFYNNLLESAEMKTIFNATSANSSTLTVQKERLWAMLNAAVSGLDDVNALVPTLRALGARHKNYGVNEGHFGAVGASLIYTLGQGLGDAFNDTLKNEWLTIYGVVQTEMVKGLNDPDNTTVVADKQAAYGLTPTAAGVPQCVVSEAGSTEPADPASSATKMCGFSAAGVMLAVASWW